MKFDLPDLPTLQDRELPDSQITSQLGFSTKTKHLSYPLDSDKRNSLLQENCLFNQKYTKVEAPIFTFSLIFRCERKKFENSSQHVCVWDYDGTGSQYQILAGPVFILVFSISGIPLGFCAGVFHRRNLIVFCLLLWSAMTLLTGFATKYWHLVITRFILGIG